MTGSSSILKPWNLKERERDKILPELLLDLINCNFREIKETLFLNFLVIIKYLFYNKLYINFLIGYFIHIIKIIFLDLFNFTIIIIYNI